MSEGREASASRAGDSGTGSVSACGVICGSSAVLTLRLLPFAAESGSVVPGSGLRTPRPKPEEDRRITVPTRERKDGLGDGLGEGLAIAVR